MKFILGYRTELFIIFLVPIHPLRWYRFLRYSGTGSSAMMVPIRALRWYRLTDTIIRYRHSGNSVEVFAPPRTVIFCRFLRVGRKQKIPISLGNQDFTVFCFSSKWCHQESNRGHNIFDVSFS